MRFVYTIICLLMQALSSGCSPIDSRMLTAGSRRDSSENWSTYQNVAYAIFFQYPPNLVVKEPDPKAFGLPELRLAVDLHPKEDPSIYVLRLLVCEPMNTRMVRTLTKKEIELLSTKYWDENYNGFRVLVTYTIPQTAAVPHWDVYRFGNYVYHWFPMLNGDSMIAGFGDAKDGPQDGSFPMLSILRSVRYDYHK